MPCISHKHRHIWSICAYQVTVHRGACTYYINDLVSACSSIWKSRLLSLPFFIDFSSVSKHYRPLKEWLLPCSTLCSAFKVLLRSPIMIEAKIVLLSVDLKVLFTLLHQNVELHNCLSFTQ